MKFEKALKVVFIGKSTDHLVFNNEYVALIRKEIYYLIGKGEVVVPLSFNQVIEREEEYPLKTIYAKEDFSGISKYETYSAVLVESCEEFYTIINNSLECEKYSKDLFSEGLTKSTKSEEKAEEYIPETEKSEDQSTLDYPATNPAAKYEYLTKVRCKSRSMNDFCFNQNYLLLEETDGGLLVVDDRNNLRVIDKVNENDFVKDSTIISKKKVVAVASVGASISKYGLYNVYEIREANKYPVFLLLDDNYKLKNYQQQYFIDAQSIIGKTQEEVKQYIDAKIQEQIELKNKLLEEEKSKEELQNKEEQKLTIWKDRIWAVSNLVRQDKLLQKAFLKVVYVSDNLSEKIKRISLTNFIWIIICAISILFKIPVVPYIFIVLALSSSFVMFKAAKNSIEKNNSEDNEKYLDEIPYLDLPIETLGIIKKIELNICKLEDIQSIRHYMPQLIHVSLTTTLFLYLKAETDRKELLQETLKESLIEMLKYTETLIANSLTENLEVNDRVLEEIISTIERNKNVFSEMTVTDNEIQKKIGS